MRKTDAKVKVGILLMALVSMGCSSMSLELENSAADPILRQRAELGMLNKREQVRYDHDKQWVIKVGKKQREQGNGPKTLEQTREILENDSTSNRKTF